MRHAVLCLIAVLATLSTAAASPASSLIGVGDIDITVSDLNRSVSFFTHVLDFKEESETNGVQTRVARLTLGDEHVDLTEYAVKGRDVPADSHANDAWFQHIAIITSDMNAAFARLALNHVRYASTAPQRLPDWNRNAAGIRAFYFRDPDGHFLEILQFPPDKGLPKWHTPSKQLFLGIDHTAIVVIDTERSLHFYRDLLGMRIAGNSENYGIEQERLNNVAGAHLRITTLRAPSGPGIELLEYLAPRTGRPAPPDERANDLIHWQTTLFFKRTDIEMVSDPDGHALEFEQQP